MRKTGSVLFLGLSILFIVGCPAKIKKPEWKFQKEAIRIYIKKDHQLSLYQNKAHTLYVCFYQLSELNAFNQLTRDSSGIRKLLECKSFDSSVAAVNSKIIHAGDNLTIKLDRAERAQYLAIVTGYFSQLDDTRMVRRHKIQVHKKRVGRLKNEYQYIPCIMDIELSLGPNRIEYSKVMIKDKGCKDKCE